MAKLSSFLFGLILLISCGNRHEGPTNDVLSEDTTILKELEAKQREQEESLRIQNQKSLITPDTIGTTAPPEEIKKDAEKPVKEEKREEKKEEDLTGYESATIVDKTGLDGCNFMIKLSSGKQLEPVNLPPTFKKDGMQVYVKYRKAEGRMSICMAGGIVEIVDIKKR